MATYEKTTCSDAYESASVEKGLDEDTLHSFL